MKILKRLKAERDGQVFDIFIIFNLLFGILYFIHVVT